MIDITDDTLSIGSPWVIPEDESTIRIGDYIWTLDPLSPNGAVRYLRSYQPSWNPTNASEYIDEMTLDPMIVTLVRYQGCATITKTFSHNDFAIPDEVDGKQVLTIILQRITDYIVSTEV